MHPSVRYSPGEGPPTMLRLGEGFAGLDGQSLLARILSRRSGPSERAAAALLDRFASLAAVAGADSDELARVVGVDPAQVEDLKLVREFGVRLARIEASRRPAIASWSALVAYTRTALSGLPRE